MKNKENSKKTTLRENLFYAALLLSFPITALAYTDNEIGAWQQGWVGSHTFSLSYSQSMAVGQYHTVSSYNSLAVGDSLTLTDGNSLVIGKFNEAATGMLLTVANGTYSTPKNLFEVHADGTVVITEQQGDVPMGDYTAP